MLKKYRLTSLLICALLPLQLIACSFKPSSSASTETTKETNVFEATSETSAVTAASLETFETTETTTPPTETAATVTSVTTAATEKDPTPTPSETTGSTSASQATETSNTSGTTSETGTASVPKDCLAVYEAEPQDKKNYIIYNNASGSTITSKASGKGFSDTQIPLSDIYLTGKLPADALEFTIFYDERMNFTLRDLSGNFLVMTADGGLILTDRPVEDWYQFWRMEKVDGGYIIVNTGETVKMALRCDSGVFTAERYFNNSSFVFNFFEVG